MPRTLNPLFVTGLMARLACIAAALAVAGGAHAQQGGATKPAATGGMKNVTPKKKKG